MKILVPQKGLPQNNHISIPLRIIATITINLMIIPIIFADVSVWIYQEVYFGIMKIPKIPRSSYIKINRHTLPNLTWAQKWSCWYCEYSNSIFAWIKAVGNQTETYSCAIKYTYTYPGLEYQSEFHDPQEFETKKISS